MLDRFLRDPSILTEVTRYYCRNICSRMDDAYDDGMSIQANEEAQQDDLVDDCWLHDVVGDAHEMRKWLGLWKR